MVKHKMKALKNHVMHANARMKLKCKSSDAVLPSQAFDLKVNLRSNVNLIDTV